MNETRYYLIDIARGLAAFTVVIFHYKIFYGVSSTQQYINENSPFYNILYFVYEFGWMGVQFFFTLSGFIFYALYLEKIKNKKISKWQFFKLRFSRLYPLHLLTFILIILLFFYHKQENFPVMIDGDIKHFLLNIFLIQTWGFEDFHSFNGPSWSISIEFFLYIIFFNIFFKIKKHDYKVTLFSILTGIFIFFINKYIGYGLYCFFFGGLAFLIYKNLISNNFSLYINCLINFIMLIFIILILSYINNPILIKIFVFSFLFPMLIINLMLIQNIFNKAGRLLSIIGDVSYSVYLLHFVLQICIKTFLLNQNIKVNFDKPIFFILYLTTLFILALISFNFFEKPIQKFLRR
jgi:peptidoglycan/LPS O-acetylase OafA/YrhL